MASVRESQGRAVAPTVAGFPSAIDAHVVPNAEKVLMSGRREFFPNVIEMNHQARRRLGCSVYLVYDSRDWLLIDIGFEDTVAEIVDLIRQMDFPLSSCRI